MGTRLIIITIRKLIIQNALHHKHMLIYSPFELQSPPYSHMEIYVQACSSWSPGVPSLGLWLGPTAKTANGICAAVGVNGQWASVTVPDASDV